MQKAWNPSTTVATVSGIQTGLLCKSGYPKLRPKLYCHGKQYKISMLWKDAEAYLRFRESKVETTAVGFKNKEVGKYIYK